MYPIASLIGLTTACAWVPFVLVPEAASRVAARGKAIIPRHNLSTCEYLVHMGTNSQSNDNMIFALRPRSEKGLAINKAAHS